MTDNVTFGGFARRWWQTDDRTGCKTWPLAIEAEHVIDDTEFWQAVEDGTARCTYTQSGWYERSGEDTTYTIVGLERCDFHAALLHAETDPPTHDLYLMDSEEIKIYEVTL